ncbi:MAG: helix-turn-helix transcriptional regulator [Oscillospiraceae bacterium]|nr:helix-turn-helix transcriptional regulator [Oscillospiraceae bacterium]MBR6561548.1 helix-turn-helix transcriptional regulator [Oscillospiraceae bacterium]
MDQIKIGKFIAGCRKKKNLTQMQLAEKLNITDRAVSKWETGKALPDSSIMLALCEILGITVNDLLSGEIVTMDHYNKELENNLLEMIKQKEASDKRLLMLEWVVGGLSLIILMAPIICGALLPIEPEWVRIVIVFSGFIPALIGFHFAIKIEQTAGYYECSHCKHKYVPKIQAMYAAPHMGRTRYMRCPECGKKSWQKKVLSKD